MGNMIIMLLYQIVSILTLIFLLYQDWHETSDFLSFALCFVINIFLSEIWPIYWLVLHWI